MSATGVNYTDLLPGPEKTNAISDPDQEEQSHALADGETASHAIATGQAGEIEVTGKAQEAHDNEVRDLGWNAPEETIPSPLVGGMNNEELWMLIRRFNKQTYHVKEITRPVPGNLDLNIADEDEFSPDKLRSTLERLYMTVGIGLLGLGKHIVRLRSWREQRRTACFTAVYFIAWVLDLLVPTFACTLITLIVFPPSRSLLFPPAPLALVDGSTGGVHKPPSGVLGSVDSATGAPENHKGEAVEQEASNFVNGIAHVALSSATGKHPANEEDAGQDAPTDSVPDPSAMALGAANARTASAGERRDEVKDKTKQPVEAKMWTQMRPIMHGLQDVADTWERFANMLSATSPFPKQAPRLRLASVVVPLLAISLVTTSYMYMKGVTFGIGFGFFGDPVIQRGLAWMNQEYPNWQKMLELRNTILKGIPTNAQLTITLLRTGEHNKSPLPPPPTSYDAPPDVPVDITDDHLGSAGKDLPLGATEAEIREAMAHDPSMKATLDSDKAGTDVAGAADTSHGKKGSRILGALKSSVKASVEGALGADRLKATAGSNHAKNRLGVLPRPGRIYTSGPVDFKCRYHGRKGHAYISTKATIPCVSFTTDPTVEKIGTQEREDLHPAWSIAVADIKELKKIGGFGWKAKLVIGWATDREVADALEITDKRDNKWRITALPLRDELFNRLSAMGGQKWEAW